MNIRAASRLKRQRKCAICSAEFLVRKADHAGKTCSKQCLSKFRSNLKKGKKQSSETVARRSASLKLARADPEKNAKWNAAVAAGVRRWHEDPDNAKSFADRASERMRRLHTDPEFQERRNERSSRTMKANWEKHREAFVADAIKRYARMEASEQGICSPESILKKNTASKWIMKRAASSLHSETDYNAIYAEVQVRLRREHPYDGPQDGSEYMDYLRKLGSLTVNDPQCRKIADTFMSDAIPRFAKEWNKAKRTV